MSLYRYYFPALIWAIVVGLLTLVPGEKLPDVPITAFDLMAHLAVFCLLTFLLVYGGDKRSVPKKANIAWSVLISTFYGVGIEIAQRHIPGRAYELMDIAADALGSVAGIIIYFATVRVLRVWRNRN